MNIADQDKPDMAKLADEFTHLRSREAFAAGLEVAYALGRRTGFREAGEFARESLGIAKTDPPSPSEGTDHG